MNPTSIEMTATALFAVAIVHTFVSSRFQHLAHRFPEGSVRENLFHLLGEVEVVFGLWAAVFIVAFASIIGATEAIAYVESLNFVEPMFVFAVMAIAATKPVLACARALITILARALPLPDSARVFLCCLIVGPLLGSFITEPAAMTVTALILRDRFFSRAPSPKFMYAALAVLFVNVSIGGVLTNFAAPPVLMVAGQWEWSSAFMMQNFGWKAALAVVINASALTWYLRKELRSLGAEVVAANRAESSPKTLIAVHLAFLALVVLTAHHPVIFIGLFLLFLGVATITREYQDELYLKQSLLVAFFLGGLVVLGGLQRWWLEPVLSGLPTFSLFLGSAGLTAITDNAALTYLGSQIPSLGEASKYSLVAGAVAGGGLTVIANAPNPAGFAILQDSFGPDRISPVRLLLAALLPTLVSLICFWVL